MFPDPTPKLNDTDNNLLFKIAQILVSGPKIGDTNTLLLAKIVRTLNTSGSGNYPAMHGDTQNTLLWKWAALVSEI